MCAIKCAVVSVFKFTVNEATTSSYQDVHMEGESKRKVKARGRLAVTLTLMLTITESIVGK